jgi:hypothetical protein
MQGEYNVEKKKRFRGFCALLHSFFFVILTYMYVLLRTNDLQGDTTPQIGFYSGYFPPVSSGCTTAVIGSAAKFNSGFVENRCKLFTAVLI